MALHTSIFFQLLDTLGLRQSIYQMAGDFSTPEPNRKTWLVVGASRGIGFEFVRQLNEQDERIYATVRKPEAVNASSPWSEIGRDDGRCQVLECDVLSEASINV